MSSTAPLLTAPLAPGASPARPAHTGLTVASLGRAYVVFVPLLAGIATVRGVDIAGFNYAGFLWVIELAVGAALLLDQLTVRSRRRIDFPAAPWLAWLAYLGLSLLWLDEGSYLQVQAALQMGMPVLVGVLASLFIRTRPQLEQLVRTYFLSLLLLVGFVGLGFAGVLSLDELDPVFVAVRSVSLTAVVIGGLFIAGTKRRFGRGWLGWAACLAVTVATGSRMASVAMLALPILNPVTRQPLRKAAAVLAVGLVGLGVYLSPLTQQRFFYGGSGDFSALAAGEFDSSGRFESWPLVVEQALKRPWLGYGVGSVQVFLPGVWPEVTHPHNDYLRLLYELGGAGLALFLGVVGWQLWALRRAVRRTSGVVQQAFGGAWLGLAVFLLIAVTDNPIVYHVWYMNPVLALAGAAYAVARQEERDAHAAAG